MHVHLRVNYRIAVIWNTLHEAQSACVESTNKRKLKWNQNVEASQTLSTGMEFFKIGTQQFFTPHLVLRVKNRCLKVAKMRAAILCPPVCVCVVKLGWHVWQKYQIRHEPTFLKVSCICKPVYGCTLRSSNLKQKWKYICCIHYVYMARTAKQGMQMKIIVHFLANPCLVDDDDVELNVLGCRLTY